MTAVAVLTPDDLTTLIRSAVRAELDAQRSAEREVLTREQAAELLQIHPDVLVRYVRTAGLPATKLGVVWRFRRSDLIAWLEARAVRAHASPTRIGERLAKIR